MISERLELDKSLLLSPENEALLKEIFDFLCPSDQDCLTVMKFYDFLKKIELLDSKRLVKQEIDLILSQILGNKMGMDLSKICISA
jgi:hypothetical protein